MLNLLIVWALTGFWHGAQWNFILWGLYYGALLLLEKLFLSRYLGRCPKAVQWMYAMFFVLIGWVIFNLTDFSQMAAALKMMFSFIPTDFTGVLVADTAIIKGVLYIPLGLLCALPIAPKLRQHLSQSPSGHATGLLLVLENLACLVLLVICVIYIISMSYNPFIYFRF